MGVKVTFHRQDDEADAPAARAVALVPKAAIRSDNGQAYAFVVSGEGVVDRRAVTTGGADGDLLEVLAGLGAGERVIVSPPPTLASGVRVVARQR
jgi:hypothetical protein